LFEFFLGIHRNRRNPRGLKESDKNFGPFRSWDSPYLIRS